MYLAVLSGVEAIPTLRVERRVSPQLTVHAAKSYSQAVGRVSSASILQSMLWQAWLTALELLPAVHRASDQLVSHAGCSSLV